jgi:cobalamin biosynthesis protein CobT
MIGSPLIQAADERKTVKQVFGDAEFPVRLMVTNHLACDIVIPELGVSLKHVSNADGMNKGETLVKDIDQLTRAVSDAEQIAMLNQTRLFLVIEEVSGDSGEGETPPPKDEGDGGQGGEDQPPSPDDGGESGEGQQDAGNDESKKLTDGKNSAKTKKG